MNIKLILGEDFTVRTLKKYASKLIEQGYGFEEGEELLLENFEALYLLFKNQASIEYKGKELSFDEAMKYFTMADKRAWEKFLVYMKLKERNYLVRKGYGGPYDFLLYERGSSINEEAAKYIVSIVHEGKSLEMNMLDEMLAFAIRMRKTLVLAVIDSNSDVSFYEASKITL